MFFIGNFCLKIKSRWESLPRAQLEEICPEHCGVIMCKSQSGPVPAAFNLLGPARLIHNSKLGFSVVLLRRHFISQSGTSECGHNCLCMQLVGLDILSIQSED